jgi:hypothetical protein
MISYFCLSNKKIEYNQFANDYNKRGYVFYKDPRLQDSFQEAYMKLNDKKLKWDGKTGRLINNPEAIIGVQLQYIFDHSVDSFLKSVLKCDYKIFYHTVYRTQRTSFDEQPQGSQLWHSDGGPGTCIILMLCYSSSTPENGSMECLEWPQSLGIHRYIERQYQKNKRLLLHKTKQEIRSFRAHATQQYLDNHKLIPSQPNIITPGCIYAFNNNVIHRGGYGRVVGRTRIVSIMHVYPCLFASELEKKLANNSKTTPYPLPFS